MKVRTMLLIVAAVLVLASMASAVQVQLACVANAREGGGWDTNYMFMQGIEYGALRPFFKFDISVMPANVIVNSATVNTYMYYGSIDPDMRFAAREVFSDWGESGPMFPAVGTVDLGPVATLNTSTMWITNTIDPTLVQDWINGSKANYGVCVSKAVTAPEICVRNRWAGAEAPYMLVDYTPVPEPGSMFSLAMGVFGLGGLVLRKRK
jgi:hypothetical protein